MTLVMVEPFLKLSRSTTLEASTKKRCSSDWELKKCPQQQVLPRSSPGSCVYMSKLWVSTCRFQSDPKFPDCNFSFSLWRFSISKCWPSETEQGPFAFPAPVLLCRVEPGCACDGPAPESGRACPASWRAAANTFFQGLSSFSQTSAVFD